MALDHDARLAGYAALAQRVWPSVCGSLPGARVELEQFTLDERLVRRAGQRGAAARPRAGARSRPRSRRATRASGRWRSATRSCSAPRRCAEEVDEIVAALRAIWSTLDDG